MAGASQRRPDARVQNRDREASRARIPPRASRDCRAFAVQSRHPTLARDDRPEPVEGTGKKRLRAHWLAAFAGNDCSKCDAGMRKKHGYHGKATRPWKMIEGTFFTRCPIRLATSFSYTLPLLYRFLRNGVAPFPGSTLSWPNAVVEGLLLLEDTVTEWERKIQKEESESGERG